MQTSTTPGSNRLIGWLRPLFAHLKNSLRVLLVLALVVLLVVLWVYGPELPYYDTYPLADHAGDHPAGGGWAGHRGLAPTGPPAGSRKTPAARAGRSGHADPARPARTI